MIDKFVKRKFISAKKFEEWKIDSLQIPKVCSIHDSEELFELTKDLVARNPPEKRGCYYTASECVIHCQNVNYVLGYTTWRNSINDHAWNSYKGVEFDLMKQINIQYDKYFKVIEMSTQELLDYLFTNGYLKDYALLEYYYKHKIASENDYVSSPEDYVIGLYETIKKLL
ncbi:hypothetical protein LCGC14_1532260 [marine sediment metagenome]|uniref:Uncharacterized protein n=1 Tax=marine sediment metagenome TaxID=412755 RepID=A0A0F9LWE7_9ZZZZ